VRVAIDLLPITGRNAGLQTYARQLVISLAKVDQEIEYVLLVNARTERFFGVIAPNFTQVVIRTPKRFIGPWEQIRLPVSRILCGVDLLHTPVSPPPLSSPCRTVVTIHDLTFKLFPETMQWWDRLYWDFFTSHGVKHAAAIITPSLSTKTDVVKHWNVPEDMVAVIPECCDHRFYDPLPKASVTAVKDRLGIPGPYVLCVATLEPRKNISTLICAFHLVKQRIDVKHSLVLAGGRGWLFKDIFRTVKGLGLERDVVFTGFVPDEDLPALYQGAELFVYPSLYEGFGLPPLEAMASGTPVVASNSSSIPEVVGDAGILVNPHDVESIAQAMIEVLTNRDLREELVLKGKLRAQQFTPERMARQTANVYRKTLEVVE